ncbi:hypothetical protein ASZ90_002065 [hydrocarbon metagenome]|uniref:Uncharacterized protein n=1 Tax=hydrocarbon metagenome TaxID=938273 RepID=A0A0W8G4H3_9ZZZZ
MAGALFFVPPTPSSPLASPFLKMTAISLKLKKKKYEMFIHFFLDVPARRV